MDTRVPLLGTGSATPASDHDFGSNNEGFDYSFHEPRFHVADAIRNRWTACRQSLRNMPSCDSFPVQMAATTAIALTVGIGTGAIVKAATDDRELASTVGGLVFLLGFFVVPAGRRVYQMASRRLAQRVAPQAYV